MRLAKGETRESKMAFLRQAVMKERAFKAQSKKVFDAEARKAFVQQARIKIAEHRARMEERARNAQSKKVFDAEARKAFLQQARIKIAEHRARMEERARNADPMAPTSSTASPPKPSSNLVLELPKSSSPAADENSKEKHNSHDVFVKPPWAESDLLGVVKEINRCVYDSQDPLFQKSVVPGYIKEYCTLALKKYNNEKGTNYRYVRPLRAHEVGLTLPRDVIFTLTFRASQSDSDSDSDTFITKITSGLRFSKGDWSFGEEVQQVSQVPGTLPFGW